MAIPFFHVAAIFGYWPCGTTLAVLWSIFDNTLNWTTNTHMLYMSYTRLRGIQNPKGFSNEILIQKPTYIMSGLWATGFLIFIPFVLICGMIEYTIKVDYQPFYIQSFVIILIWFSPLFLILVFSIQIMVELSKREKKRGNIVKKIKLKSFRLTSVTKFQILILTYWIQWFIPCVFDTIQPCNCIPFSVNSAIYWLTYTV